MANYTMTGKPNQGKTLVPKMTHKIKRKEKPWLAYLENKLQSMGRSETSKAVLQMNKILIAKHIGTVRLDKDKANVSSYKDKQ